MASSGEAADCDQLNTPRLTIGLGRNQGGLENLNQRLVLRLLQKKREASHFAAQPTVMSFSSHSAVLHPAPLCSHSPAFMYKGKKKDNSVPHYTVCCINPQNNLTCPVEK